MGNKEGNHKRELRLLDIRDAYQSSLRKRWIVLGVLALIVIALYVVGIFVGSSGMSFSDVVMAIFGQGNETNKLIVWNIRTPRVIAAVLAGAGLALSGCIMQATLKNPMASPSTLGVSNAAVLGANIALIVLGGGTIISTNVVNNPYLVTLMAFGFSLLSILFILFLSKFRNFSPEVVVLAGIGIGTLFTGITTLIQYFSSDTQLASAVYWTFGDLGRATYQEDAIMAVVLLVCLVVFFLFRWSYNAMRAGDDTAKSLGIRVDLVRFVSLLLASLITAVTISFFGIIGFLGIIAPHIMKRVIGNDYRFLIPASALTGSAVLLFSDTIGRIIIPGTSIPVGAITAILGAPVFIFIIFARKEARA